MIGAYSGAFFTSLVIIVCSRLLDLTDSQKKAMHHLFLTRKAAASIKAALRYNLELRKFKKAIQQEDEI